MPNPTEAELNAIVEAGVAKHFAAKAEAENAAKADAAARDAKRRTFLNAGLSAGAADFALSLKMPTPVDVFKVVGEGGAPLKAS